MWCRTCSRACCRCCLATASWRRHIKTRRSYFGHSHIRHVTVSSRLAASLGRKRAGLWTPISSYSDNVQIMPDKFWKVLGTVAFVQASYLQKRSVLPSPTRRPYNRTGWKAATPNKNINSIKEQSEKEVKTHPGYTSPRRVSSYCGGCSSGTCGDCILVMSVVRR